MAEYPGDGQLCGQMAAIRTGMGRRVVEAWNGIVRYASIQGDLPFLFARRYAFGKFGDIGRIGKCIAYAVGCSSGTVDDETGALLKDRIAAYQHAVQGIHGRDRQRMTCRVPEGGDGVDAADEGE